MHYKQNVDMTRMRIGPWFEAGQRPKERDVSNSIYFEHCPAQIA